jgi:hypothetical protein
MTKKQKSLRAGKKSSGESLKRIVVSLDDPTAKMALALGDGDLSLGIRRAVALISLRQHRQPKPK